MKLGTELSAATFWMVVIFCLRMGLWELRQWLVGLAWGCVLTELTVRRKCKASDGGENGAVTGSESLGCLILRVEQFWVVSEPEFDCGTVDLSCFVWIMTGPNHSGTKYF